MLQASGRRTNLTLLAPVGCPICDGAKHAGPLHILDPARRRAQNRSEQMPEKSDISLRKVSRLPPHLLGSRLSM